MTRTLVPCASCHRHAWSTEPACPFCGGALGAAVMPVAPPGARLGRAALLLAGGLAVSGAGGCSPAKPKVENTPPPDSTMVALYGAPAPDPTTEPGPEPVPEPDPGGMMPKYGAPPPPDDGGNAPKYGGPPPP
jgi:hypothetical protein